MTERNLPAITAGSAIEICRSAGMDPVAILIEASRTINELAQLTLKQKADLIERLDVPSIEFVVRLLSEAARFAHMAAPFAHPRLSSIDVVGEAPKVTVQNRFVFKLKLGAQPPDWANKIPE